MSVILQYPGPRDAKSLQGFLGMLGLNRQFIPKYAELSQPLNQLLCKGMKGTWQQGHEQAFISLTLEIANTDFLRLQDLKQPFIIQASASDYGLGAILLQEYSEGLRPVDFVSLTLPPGERNYSATEKE